jgi:hypothetical protein
MDGSDWRYTGMTGHGPCLSRYQASAGLAGPATAPEAIPVYHHNRDGTPDAPADALHVLLLVPNAADAVALAVEGAMGPL